LVEELSAGHKPNKDIQYKIYYLRARLCYANNDLEGSREQYWHILNEMPGRFGMLVENKRFTVPGLDSAKLAGLQKQESLLENNVETDANGMVYDHGRYLRVTEDGYLLLERTQTDGNNGGKPLSSRKANDTIEKKFAKKKSLYLQLGSYADVREALIPHDLAGGQVVRDAMEYYSALSILSPESRNRYKALKAEDGFSRLFRVSIFGEDIRKAVNLSRIKVLQQKAGLKGGKYQTHIDEKTGRIFSENKHYNDYQVAVDWFQGNEQYKGSIKAAGGNWEKALENEIAGHSLQQTVRPASGAEDIQRLTKKTSHFSMAFDYLLRTDKPEPSLYAVNYDADSDKNVLLTKENAGELGVRLNSKALKPGMPEELSVRKVKSFIEPDSQDVKDLLDKKILKDVDLSGITGNDLTYMIQAYLAQRFDYTDPKTAEASKGKAIYEWQSVAETIRTGKGSCHDLANLQASLLLAALTRLGMKKDNLSEKAALAEAKERVMVIVTETPSHVQAAYKSDSEPNKGIGADEWIALEVSKDFKDKAYNGELWGFPILGNLLKYAIFAYNTDRTFYVGEVDEDSDEIVFGIDQVTRGVTTTTHTTADRGTATVTTDSSSNTVGNQRITTTDQTTTVTPGTGGISQNNTSLTTELRNMSGNNFSGVINSNRVNDAVQDTYATDGHITGTDQQTLVLNLTISGTQLVTPAETIESGQATGTGAGTSAINTTTDDALGTVTLHIENGTATIDSYSENWIQAGDHRISTVVQGETWTLSVTDNVTLNKTDANGTVTGTVVIDKNFGETVESASNLDDDPDAGTRYEQSETRRSLDLNAANTRTVTRNLTINSAFSGLTEITSGQENWTITSYSKNSSKHTEIINGQENVYISETGQIGMGGTGTETGVISGGEINAGENKQYNDLTKTISSTGTTNSNTTRTENNTNGNINITETETIDNASTISSLFVFILAP
ncbi:hypothetical protein ACFL4D_03360, partial [Candidatus Margulisiibacteriota bacterium]